MHCVLFQSCLDANTNVSAEHWIHDAQANALLKEIMEVAALSLYFDPSVLAVCWRSVGRVVCGRKEDGESTAARKEEIIPHVIKQLCLAIDATCRQSLIEAGPLLEKRLKSGQFLCSLLLRLMSEFPKCVSADVLLQLLLSTQQTLQTVPNTALRTRLVPSLLLVSYYSCVNVYV